LDFDGNDLFTKVMLNIHKNLYSAKVGILDRQKQLFKKTLGIMLLIVFFEFLAVMPEIGYKAKIESFTVQGREQSGNMVIVAACDVAYNPFLYGFSWLGGCGWVTGEHKFAVSNVWFFISDRHTGDVYLRWRHRTPEEIRQEVVSQLSMSQFNINVLFNIVILLVIELLKLRDAHLCIFGSVASFIIGGPVGALIGFVAMAIIVLYVRLKVWKEGLFAKIWRFFLEEELYPYETPRT